MPSYSIATTSALSFMLLSSIVLMDFAYAHDCSAGYNCNFPFKATDNQEIVHNNRKFLMSLMGSQIAGKGYEEKGQYGVQMRNVPSGPDPLHHNNGPHMRPKISP